MIVLCYSNCLSILQLQLCVLFSIRCTLVVRSGGCRYYSGGTIGFAPALTVPLDECFELGQVVDDVDAAATVELRGLEEPKVEAGEVTEGHRVSEEVLLQCTLLIVQRIFLLLEVLLDKALSVVIEVFEYEGLVQG